MSIRIDKSSRQVLIFYSMLVMLLALFVSRFLLSVSLLFFLLLTCAHRHFLRQLVSLFRNRLLLAIALLFIIPFVTWFWTEDKTMWARFARIKLPLFLLPLAFAGNWQLSERQWKRIAWFFLLLMFAGCCWSLWQYAQNSDAIEKSYLKAKVMATPLENDHVRFSLLVCIAVVCSLLLIVRNFRQKLIVPLCMLCIFFVASLHVLSARTGLFAFYLFLIMGIVYLFFIRRGNKWRMVLLAVLVLLPMAAWFLFPTFQNRIRYNLYDLSNIRHNHYVPGANDGNRVLSLKAGWNVLKEHPFGVGGDVVSQSDQWYQQNFPEIPPGERLFPASELLMYAGFAGWAGVLLFICSMGIPLFERTAVNAFFWCALNSIMAFSFLFDIGLEAQFGVFIYGFFVLWWWKWFNQGAGTGT